MQCNKCRREAVLFQAYSGQHLCRQHFETDLERKAKHEIRTHRWLEPGDHIAVALSGDANSSALLYFLNKLTSSRNDIRISAITIDEGIMGYRDPVCANRIARASGTECISISFPERFGMSIDEIALRKGITPSCTYCRVLRNFLLDRIAMEHGVTKLATGDDLDDSAASVLNTILRGNTDVAARSEQTRREKIPRIRPFISVPKKEVSLYAALHVKGYDRSRCPYHNDRFEEDVRVILENFTTRHPATGYALMSLKNHLTGTWCTRLDTVASCERCGEPSDGICMTCRIIDEVTAGGS
jgi:uncharacterized protein (TIGR00269 family)